MPDLKLELERGRYLLLVQRIIAQRPEHVATTLARHPKMYPYVFHTIHTFKKIPSDFWEVYHAILRNWTKVPNAKTMYGRYSLTLHGRGKKYGNPASEARYRAGCNVKFSKRKGFRFYKLNCSQRAFRALLDSARMTNIQLCGGSKR